MQLITMHKILIASAVITSGLFAIWSAFRFFKHGVGSSGIVAVAAVAGAIGLSIYLRRFSARHRTSSTDESS